MDAHAGFLERLIMNLDARSILPAEIINAQAL